MLEHDKMLKQQFSKSFLTKNKGPTTGSPKVLCSGQLSWDVGTEMIENISPWIHWSDYDITALSQEKVHINLNPPLGKINAEITEALSKEGHCQPVNA